MAFPLRDETLASLGAARIQNSPAAAGFHARAESVGAGMLELSGLKCAFHGDFPKNRAKGRRWYWNLWKFVNIARLGVVDQGGVDCDAAPVIFDVQVFGMSLLNDDAGGFAHAVRSSGKTFRAGAVIADAQGSLVMVSAWDDAA